LPPLGELLRRFRFLGVPGAPAVTAVPTDRRTLRVAEVSPLFAALAGAEAEAAAIVATAHEEAARRRAGAEEEARTIVAGARARAVVVRADATRTRLAEAEQEAGFLLDAARQDSARLDRLRGGRVVEAADAVVERVLGLGATAGGAHRHGAAP